MFGWLVMSKQSKSKSKGGWGSTASAAARAEYPPPQKNSTHAIASTAASPASAADAASAELAAIAAAHSFTLAYPVMDQPRSQELKRLYSELFEVSQAICHTSTFLPSVSLLSLIQRQKSLKLAIKDKLAAKSAVSKH